MNRPRHGRHSHQRYLSPSAPAPTSRTCRRCDSYDTKFEDGSVTSSAQKLLSFLLVIGANEDLDPGREHDGLMEALRLPVKEHPIKVFPPLMRATHMELVRRLTEDRPDVLHFVGHGDRGQVLLIDEVDNPRSLDEAMAADLFRALAQSGSVPQLVFLNCCLALAVGKAIAREGPTVVAFESRVADAWARRYATIFYELCLGKGYDMDAANTLAINGAGPLPRDCVGPCVILGRDLVRRIKLKAKNLRSPTVRHAWQAASVAFFVCAVFLGIATNVVTLRGCAAAGPQDISGTNLVKSGAGNDTQTANPPQGSGGEFKQISQPPLPITPTRNDPIRSTPNGPKARPSRTVLVIPPLNRSGRMDEIDLKVPGEALKGQAETVRVSQLTRDVQGRMGDAISELCKSVNNTDQAKGLQHIDRDRFDQLIAERMRGESGIFEQADPERLRALKLADIFVTSEIGPLSIYKSKPDPALGLIATKLCRGSVKIKIQDATTGENSTEATFDCKGVVFNPDSPDDLVIGEWLKDLKDQMTKSQKAVQLKQALKDLSK